MNLKKLSPEQIAVVLERRRLWRQGLLKEIARDFDCSISTIRRIEREWQQRMGMRVDRKRPNPTASAEGEA